MPEATVYLNGRFMPAAEAGIDIEDRGHLFGDGVYEVVRYYGGRPFRMQPHVERLKRSLDGICLPGVDSDALAGVSDELVRRNALAEAKVYWQITRGVPAGGRNHVFPSGADAAAPTVLMIAYPGQPLDPEAPPKRTTAIIAEDTRWTRPWIKSLMLLPNTLAKTAAAAAGAGEAILERAKPGTDQRHITEGSATNIAIVTGGTLRTHPDDGWILGGITRGFMLESCRTLGIPVDETPYGRDDVYAADEVMLTSSTSEVTAITRVDDRPVSDRGDAAGPVARRLHRHFMDTLFG